MDWREFLVVITAATVRLSQMTTRLVRTTRQAALGEVPLGDARARLAWRNSRLADQAENKV